MKLSFDRDQVWTFASMIGFSRIENAKPQLQKDSSEERVSSDLTPAFYQRDVCNDETVVSGALC